MAGIKILAPAAGALVSTAEAKLHLGVRQGNTALDSQIDGWVASATDMVETLTGRSLLTRTLRQSWDAVPEIGCPLRLAYPPLVSVDTIEYLFEDTWTEWDGDEWRVDTDAEPGLVVPAFGEVWPIPSVSLGTAVLRATFDCGFGATASSVPRILRDAAKMLVGHWFENREAVSSQQAAVYRPFQALEVPLGVKSMCIAWNTGEMR